MQQRVGVMVSGWIQMEELAIEHVGEPGERMPVALVIAGERPLDRLPIETIANVSVVRYVAIVVVVDKRMPADRVVECDAKRR